MHRCPAVHRSAARMSHGLDRGRRWRMADPALPDVFTRREALQRGMSRHQIERRVSTGAWRQLRRGTYCRSSTYDGAGHRGRHELEVTAVVLSRPDDVLVSHLSAACLLGWPRPLEGWGRVSVTAEPGTVARARPGLVVQAATVRPADRTLRGGVALTSPARTLADVLRHVAPAQAVAIADHALRSRAVEHAEVAEVLHWQREWPYASRGIDSLKLADPRRETWLESWSFVSLLSHGVPLPVPQVEVLDARGRFVARLDGLWDLATGAEADGRIKYDLSGVLMAGADPQASADELIRRAQVRLDEEKARQDAILDTGLQLVRWGTREVLLGLPGLARRINEHRASADASRFSGRFRCRPAPPWLGT